MSFKLAIILFSSLIAITVLPSFPPAAATGQTFNINSESACVNTSDYTVDTSNGCTINNLNLQPGDTLDIGLTSTAIDLGSNGVNDGTINIGTNDLLSTFGNSLTNNGVINISGGVLVSAWNNNLKQGNLVNNGQIQITSDGQLQTDGGGLTDNGQITIDNGHTSGIFEDVPYGVEGAATDVIGNGGAITSAGQIQVYGISIQPAGTLSATGLVNAQNTISNSGTFTTTNQIFADTFNNNGHLTLSGSSLIDARFFNNDNGGLVDNSSPQFNIGAGSQNLASGTFVNNGGGTINNHGSMNMFGGINNGGLLNNFGSFNVDTQTSIYNTGVIVAECGSTPIVDIINGIQQVFPNGITNGCVPPSLSITSPANNTDTKNTSVAVSGTASDPASVSGETWNVDSGAVSAATGTTSWSFTTGTLADGFHIIQINATSPNGLSTERHLGVTVDTIPPVIAPVSSQTVEATGPAGAVATFTATATDNIDGTDPVTCSPASGSTFPIGSTTVTCNSQDKAGNAALPVTFTVTVQDTAPPVLTLPSDITQETTGPSGNVVTFSATATDIVDGTDPVTCSPASGSTFPIGTTTVTCSSTDAHGNKASGTFHVIIQDTAPPVLTLPSDITQETTGPSGNVVTFSASATDIVDGTDPVTCSPASGSTFPIGTTTVTCSSTDAHGNKASGTFHVIIQDTIPPTITVTNIHAKATGPLTPVTFSPTATDIVDGTDPVTCSPASGSSFPLGSTTVTCSSTDAHGNKATAAFTVTVSETTAPSITLPASITQETTGPSGNVVTFSASATDIVDGTDPVTCSPASGSTFPIGNTTVTCTSTNHVGNTSTGSFFVLIRDTTPPVLSLPADITKEATGLLTPVTFSASATDIVDGTDPVTCSPASGSSFPLGSTTVTCSSTDAHGNKATGTFHVIIQDTIPPTLTIVSPSNGTIVTSAAVPFSGTASDNVQVSSVTWKVDSGTVSTATGTTGWSFDTSSLSPGTHTVYINATDESGNAARSLVTLTYVEPTVTLPPPSGGTTPVSFSSSSGGFTALQSVSKSSLAVPPPPGNYPLGFFSWSITGFAPSNSVTVTITSPVPLHHQSHYFKLVGGHWVSIPVSVHGNNMTMTILDNGPFDGDPAAGTITDPGAVANPTDGRVTGGGHIGNGIDFGFEVTSDVDRNDNTHGTLDFHDRAANINLHSNRVSFLSVDNTTTQATFSGSGDVGTTHNDIFIVSVTDPDRTGNHDTFSITVTDSSGNVVYSTSGTVHGHIEIHKFQDHDGRPGAGNQRGPGGNDGNDDGRGNRGDQGNGHNSH